jgi:hypothetical protein
MRFSPIELNQAFTGAKTELGAASQLPEVAIRTIPAAKSASPAMMPMEKISIRLGKTCECAGDAGAASGMFPKREIRH